MYQVNQRCQIQGTRRIVSVDVKQQIRIRGGHRAHVSKLLRRVSEVAPDDEEQIELLRISLKGKLSVSWKTWTSLFWSSSKKAT